MSNEGTINWLNMSIKNREQKLADLKAEREALNIAIPAIEAALQRDKDELQGLGG
jgi:septal ring factor EnvC (AmiA/AmiB activator)